MVGGKGGGRHRNAVRAGCWLPAGCAACRLEQQHSWGQYWNYLRRQLFVLDTYSNHYNRTLNWGMMAFHSWASAAFALPVIMGEPICCTLI